MAKAMTAKELHWAQGKTRGALRATRPRLVQWAKLYKTQTVAPTNVDVPVITGAPNVGHTLETTMGNWNGSPSAYGAQWKRDGANILNATFAKYLLVTADAGHTLTCTITAFTGGGQANVTTSGVAVT
jgi:hypothetical protein